MNMWKKNKKENLSQEKIEEQFKKLEVPILDMPPRGTMKRVRDTYSVGYIDGDTIVKLTCGDLTLALTLSPSEVRRLIRLLEATMDDPNDQDTQDNVTKKANDSLEN